MGKRVILNNLGIPTATPTLGVPLAGITGLAATASQQTLPTQTLAAFAAAQNAAAVAAAAANQQVPTTVAASAGHMGSYGKLLSTQSGIPSLSSFRYAPYPIPSAAFAASQAVHQAQAVAAQAQAQVAALAAQQQQQQQPQGQSNTTGSGGQPGAAAVLQQSAHLSNPVSLALVASGQTGMTTTVAGQQSTAASSNQQQQQASAGGGAAAPGSASHPYTAAAAGYNLANVDMSSFQGVDWNSVYGMGMYV